MHSCIGWLESFIFKAWPTSTQWLHADRCGFEHPLPLHTPRYQVPTHRLLASKYGSWPSSAQRRMSKGVTGCRRIMHAKMQMDSVV